MEKAVALRALLFAYYLGGGVSFSNCYFLKFKFLKFENLGRCVENPWCAANAAHRGALCCVSGECVSSCVDIPMVRWWVGKKQSRFAFCDLLGGF